MNKRQLIYILSPSYSGSTLLTMLLARHPRIATIGELKATSMGELEDYKCSCGLPILNCEFWESLTEKVKQAGESFDIEDFGTHFTDKRFLVRKILGAQVRGSFFEFLRWLVIKAIPGISRQHARIVKKNNIVIDSICDIQNKDVFLDGSKDPHRLLYLINSDIWDIYVVRMIRDGRAQSNSNRRKEENKMNYRDSVIEWNRTINQMTLAGRYIQGDRIHDLRYEDLCANPKGVMDDLWVFLGLEKMQCDWNEVDIKEFEHHILGNNMRTKDKIYIALDEGWKNNVSVKELREFDRIAGKTNESLGYDG